MLVLSIVSASITARWLGPAGKGEVAIILATVALFQFVLNAGLAPANVYYAGRKRIPVPFLTENSIVFTLLGAIIGFSVILISFLSGFLRTLLPDASPAYLMLGLLLLPIMILNMNLKSILQGLRKIFVLNVLNGFQSILSVFFLSFFIIGLKLGVPGAVLASFMASLLTLLVVVYYIKQEGASFRPRWRSIVVKPMISFGIKGYIGNLMQFFNYRLDIFILNYYLGPAEVGIYGVSVTLAELLWRLPDAVSFVIFPESANSTQKDMNNFTPRVFQATFLIIFLGAVAIALVGQAVIRIVFSDAFISAYTPLLILIPGVFLFGLAKILAGDIIGRGYPQYNSITAGLALIATVILNLLLVPRMGVNGAALASTLSYCITFVSSLVFYFLISRHPNPLSVK